MNKNKELLSFSFAIMVIVFTVSNSCKKDDFKINPVNGQTTAEFNLDKAYGRLTDQDGNVYKTIKIGTQTWMAENLRTTIFRNGEPIPEITNYEDWINLSESAYCNYNNINDKDSITTFGRLYNWYTILDKRKLAPAGWHIPSDDEVTTLMAYLSAEHLTGGALKEVGTVHWDWPNYGAGNETGFTGLPGGNRNGTYGYFEIMCGSGVWGTTTKFGNYSFYGWILSYSANEPGRSRDFILKDGCSIRCLKDN
jgi:uncharacterized protein (TIGR02145 family)